MMACIKEKVFAWLNINTRPTLIRDSIFVDEDYNSNMLTFQMPRTCNGSNMVLTIRGKNETETFIYNGDVKDGECSFLLSKECLVADTFICGIRLYNPYQIAASTNFGYDVNVVDKLFTPLVPETEQRAIDELVQDLVEARAEAIKQEKSLELTISVAVDKRIELDETIEFADARNQDLREVIEKAEDTAVLLDEKMLECDGKMLECDAKMDECDRKISDVNATIVNANNANTILNGTVTNANNKNTALNTSINNASATEARLKAENDRAEALIAELKALMK